MWKVIHFEHYISRSQFLFLFINAIQNWIIAYLYISCQQHINNPKKILWWKKYFYLKNTCWLIIWKIVVIDEMSFILKLTSHEYLSNTRYFYESCGQSRKLIEIGFILHRLINLCLIFQSDLVTVLVLRAILQNTLS